MKDFDELLASALVGTSRGTLPKHAGTPLSDPLNAIGGDPETALLSRAAVAGLARFAGQSAEVAPLDPPAPAPTEIRPEVPARAARHLPLVLDTPLLPEWLALCAERGWRVSPPYLPALLDLARYDTNLREKLRPVLGERGAWLAQFNSDWKFTPAAFSEEAWEESGEAGRESLFRTLRDGNPQAARELLAAQFKTERVSSRKRLLGVVNETWQDDDLQLEPLLEEALSDRSAEVQELARRILQRLIGSAYNARMSARAAALLHLEKTGLLDKLRGKQKIKLEPLTESGPDLKRDGLADLKTAQRQFETVLAHMHPEVLMQTLKQMPAQLVETAKQLDALDELQQAVLTVKHVPLAQALLPHTKQNIGLISLAASDDLEATLWKALQQDDLELLSVLSHGLSVPWPADLSTAILSALRDSLQKVEYAYAWNPRWRNNLHPNALVKAHPDAIPPASLPDDAPDFAKQILQELTATLEQRRQIWRDFETRNSKGETP